MSRSRTPVETARPRELAEDVLQQGLREDAAGRSGGRRAVKAPTLDEIENGRRGDDE